MTYEQQQHRMIVLDETLTDVEFYHGIGCACEQCRQMTVELNFVRADLARRECLRVRALRREMRRDADCRSCE